MGLATPAVTTPLVIAMAILALVVARRILAQAFDRRRIIRYLADIGGRVSDLTWTPPDGPFWGERWQRTYAVVWRDISGVRHSSVFRTSLLAGVAKISDQVDDGSAGQDA